MFYYIGIVLAVWVGLSALLGLIGIMSKKSRFIARLSMTYFVLLVCAVYGFFLAIFMRIIGKQSSTQHAIARIYCNLLCPLTKTKFVVENEEVLERVRPAVFLGNHQTELDVLILGRVFPRHCSVSAKRSLQYIPFLGWFMVLSGTLFIDRGNRKSAFAAFEKAGKKIRDRQQSVWIFPEGTRSYSDTATVLPFKKGAFHLAVQAQVPIVPIVVQNYSHVLNHRKMHFENGEIKIKVLDPIETKGMGSSKPEIDALVEKVQKLMGDELAAIGLGNSGKQLTNGDAAHSKKVE